MKQLIIILLFLSEACTHTKLIVEKPKLQPSAVIHPNFEGYAIAARIRWDIVPQE